ncbi:hypothetical protein CR513_10305, partial [Mucuna pruriens]
MSYLNGKGEDYHHLWHGSCSTTSLFLSRHIVLGYGMIVVEFLATLNKYLKSDDKVRSSSLKIEGAGNADNTLTYAAQLGLKLQLILKVADDVHIVALFLVLAMIFDGSLVQMFGELEIAIKKKYAFDILEETNLLNFKYVDTPMDLNVKLLPNQGSPYLIQKDTGDWQLIYGL